MNKTNERRIFICGTELVLPSVGRLLIPQRAVDEQRNRQKGHYIRTRSDVLYAKITNGLEIKFQVSLPKSVTKLKGRQCRALAPGGGATVSRVLVMRCMRSLHVYFTDE